MGFKVQLAVMRRHSKGAVGHSSDAGGREWGDDLREVSHRSVEPATDQREGRWIRLQGEEEGAWAGGVYTSAPGLVTVNSVTGAESKADLGESGEAQLPRREEMAWSSANGLTKARDDKPCTSRWSDGASTMAGPAGSGEAPRKKMEHKLTS
ncbi:hypothetical protein NDU88_006426 [Pleurodeles waltl]|uniref:Uncharacterized protein n=1 Tax=Pleurodeles waltl TaxID=8319 RepID=A0AAV7N0W7_PLEWA|nr:hypothetical protein NDU88_006426 [Pleurodeles waltl]